MNISEIRTKPSCHPLEARLWCHPCALPILQQSLVPREEHQLLSDGLLIPQVTRQPSLVFSVLARTQTMAVNMRKPTPGTLLLNTQHQLSTDFNRTEEIEPKGETRELRKAQEDANATPSRGGMG